MSEVRPEITVGQLRYLLLRFESRPLIDVTSLFDDFRDKDIAKMLALWINWAIEKAVKDALSELGEGNGDIN